MKRLNSFLQKLRLGQVLSVLLVGFALLIGTACSSGDVRGAHLDNPAVQIGGENNPHKLGGDKNTNYRMSPDPDVNTEVTDPQDKRASLPVSSYLIAMADTDSSVSDLLYPDSGAEDSFNQASERPELQANPASDE